MVETKPDRLKDPLLDILTTRAVTPVPDIPQSFHCPCVGSKESDFDRLREEEYLWAVSKMQFPSYYKLVHTVFTDFQRNDVTPIAVNNFGAYSGMFRLSIGLMPTQPIIRVCVL